MSSRPVSITIVSVLWFLDAAFYAVLAVLSIVNHDALAALLRAISPGGAGPAAHLAMGRLEPVYYVAIPFIMAQSESSVLNASSLVRVAVSVLIGLLVGWYLLSAKIRAAFRSQLSANRVGT